MDLILQYNFLDLTRSFTCPEFKLKMVHNSSSVTAAAGPLTVHETHSKTDVPFPSSIIRFQFIPCQIFYVPGMGSTLML